ncbi:MAG: PAS domain S-box protein [bacterium]
MTDAPLRILIIEDRPDDAELIGEELTRHGLTHTFERVETEEALRQRLSEETWDVILSDHALPGFGGRRALEVVQEMRSAAPFIALSGTIGEDIAVGYMRAGASDYVMKQNLTRLGPAIEREVREFRARAAQHEALERAEEDQRLFRTLMDHSNDAFEVIDSETLRFVDANARAYELLGYTREEFLALSVPDVTSTVDHPGVATIQDALRLSDKTLRRDLRRRKDGSTFPVEVNLQHVSLERDYVVAVVRDITERIAAESALRAGEQRLRDLADATFEGIAFTEGGVFLDVSDQFARMFGYDRHEIIGKEATKVVAPEDRELVLSKIREEFEGPYRVMSLKKDGTLFPVEARGRTVVRGGVRQRVTAIRDLSEIEEARSTLRQTVSRHEALLEAAPIALYNGHVTDRYATTWISENIHSSALQSARQPSQLTLLPSSHTSVPHRKPFPQPPSRRTLSLLSTQCCARWHQSC